MNGYGGLHLVYGRTVYNPRCTTCKGTGKCNTEGGVTIVCDDCHGTGLVPIAAYMPPWWVYAVAALAVGLGLAFVVYGAGVSFK